MRNYRVCNWAGSCWRKRVGKWQRGGFSVGRYCFPLFFFFGVCCVGGYPLDRLVG